MSNILIEANNISKVYDADIYLKISYNEQENDSQD